MILDGTLIARELKSDLKEAVRKQGKRPSLGLVVVQETPEIRKFVALKQLFGADIGVSVDVLHLTSLKQKTEDVLQLLIHATRTYDGLVLQLPLPHIIDTTAVLKLFPLTHDVDVLGDSALEQYREHHLPFHPPVVGAMSAILERNGIGLAGQRMLVVGEGRLVGLPASYWGKNCGAQVTVVNKQTTDLVEKVRLADILVLGAGVPSLITPDMLKEGVIVLDAGTSEMGGVLRGDADPLCAGKARLFTPTPGGIGPITVAKIFENLLALMDLKRARKG